MAKIDDRSGEREREPVPTRSPRPEHERIPKRDNGRDVKEHITEVSETVPVPTRRER